MATYHYSPLPADGSSIRLFRLLPASDPSADIISELFHSSVVGSDHIPYEALSYTWGDPNQTTRIKLNGHQFAVTRNLHGALLALRHSEKPRMLWIDAVCINQSAREERGRQVRMMWQIYKAADCVIVWLGPEEWDSATAMENISKRETQRRLLARNCETEMPRGCEALDWCGCHAGDFGTMPPRTGVLNLIERQWFRRVWVLQEVAAAKKLVVVCGKNVVQGSDFYQELISTVEWYGTFSKIVRKIRPALEFMSPSSTALRQRQYRLVELMEMFRSWEATEPLDKVYALLEFSSDAYNAPDLCPDYTISKYQLARKLLELSFPGCLVHQQSEDTDLVSFQVEGFILGVIGLSRRRHIKFWKFDSVKLMNSDQGHVEFMVNSKAWELFQRGWELPVSNERKLSSGDLVCLLRGASYPTILKYSAATNFYEGECTVDMLAAPQPKFSVEQEFGDEIDTTAWAAALQTLEAESEGLMTFKLAWHPFRKPEPSQVSEFNFSPNNWQVQWEVAIASIAQIAAEKAVASQNGLENTYHWTCRQITELRVQYSGDREKIEAGQSEKNITVHKAAAGGFLESLKILLEMKVDVDVRDEFKATPLHWAAYYGHEEIVKLLLQAKATVDVVHKDGTTPLIDAAGKGHARIVEILLDAGACPNGLAAQREAPIFAPAISGRVDIVNLLLKAGADPNVRSAEIENAAPLHFAAEVGHTNIVEALLAGKAELNIRADCGCTPLHKAAQQGKFEVAKLLLHSGAEVDLQDEHGVTPLHFASQGGYTDIVRALLQKNADKGARTDAGSTPLSLAYISPDQNKETIELLEGWPTCYIGSKTRTEQQESELSHTLRPTLHGSAGKERKGRKCPTMAGMFRGLQNFR